MDIYRIDHDLKFINQIGLTLDIEEKFYKIITVQLGRNLQKQSKFDELLFWGKIIGKIDKQLIIFKGTEQDYYIAIGLQFKNSYEFPQKQLFWSSANFEFQELPMINEEYKDKIEGFNFQFFTGKHDKILIQVKDEDEEEQEEQEKNSQEGDQEEQIPDTDSEKNIQIKLKNFKELDRLSYVVRTIETQCATVPIGAYKLTPMHELRHNDQFQGLNTNNANKLEYYQHFRNVQSKSKRQQLDDAKCILRYDFLDALKDDQPQGCWSLQADTSKQFVTVRSLVWPGYIAYHQANTSSFGGAYFGDGIRNSDLAFQI